ncbi:hypothetical protein IDM40_02455 [Nocardiopsis sp. HNM0947]|uniref:DUF5709 domain-containing protein n=1 Tax=Nocardiopsis coralli TaxID=2772213 RepID=A0ABR9P180_9ACTN|nr:hypothetical protein [Nocardiopsis coralli]MBE2997569.1 hypothetical protein [Nocardiopsis coralli]
MSHHDSRRPDDPVNAEAQDWDEAGMPEQEDSTEDEALPGDREDPTTIEEEYDSSAEERDPLDEALAQEEPEAPEALGSAAPDRGRDRAGEGGPSSDSAVEPGPGGPESKALHQEEGLRQEDEGGRPGE